MLLLLHRGRGPEYCNQFVSVCLSVCACMSASISLEPLDLSSRLFMRIPCGSGSVLLLRRCDTLWTSGFMDDVTFGRSGPYGSACDTGVGESDVYECFVAFVLFCFVCFNSIIFIMKKVVYVRKLSYVYFTMTAHCVTRQAWL